MACSLPLVALAQTGGDQSGMAVTTAAAAKACITDNLYATGTVIAKDEVLVRPDGEGWRITQILVEDGERVTSGQSLARLSRVGADGTTGNLTAPVPAYCCMVLRVSVRSSLRAPIRHSVSFPAAMSNFCLRCRRRAWAG